MVFLLSRTALPIMQHLLQLSIVWHKLVLWEMTQSSGFINEASLVQSVLCLEDKEQFSLLIPLNTSLEDT